MNRLIHLFLILISSCIFGCDSLKNSEYQVYKSNFENLEDSQATRLLKKTIAHYGGWEAYTSLRGIEYKKILQKVDSTGAVYSVIDQQHYYNVFPSFKVKMEWSEKEGLDNYKIINNGEQSWKFKNDVLMTDEKNINSAYNSSHGSQYVLFMPWKLADPFVQLEYVGSTKLPGNKEGEGLKVTYAEENSTTTEHTWWYYFDKESGAQIATFLDSPQAYSYTEYLEFKKFGNLTFHTKRISYNSDSTMSQLQLNTIYINEDIMLVPSFSNKSFDYNE